jgi:hypothetical protein
MMDEPAELSFEESGYLLPQLALPAVIDNLFQAYLGRNADDAGMAAILEREMTVGQVEEMIARSPEFRRRGQLLTDQNRSQYDGAMLIIPPARILYCPIAKVANTSIKDWALRLVGDGQSVPGASHNWLDSGNNKMQARHLSLAVREQIARSPDWASVAVLRDPVERLVSCYCDKFGRNRSKETVLFHTRPAYTFFNDGRDPDEEMIARGLTFRQFCFYINHTPREGQDPHWAPQWNYLQNRKWDRLFALDKIEEFEEFVRARLPEHLKDIRLGIANANEKDDATPEKDLSDTLPDEWLGTRNPSYDAFVSEDIRSFIGNYYSLDFVLYERAQRGV